jgi:hypothetical protein
MPTPNKLSQTHRKFIVWTCATETWSPTEICRRLRDDEVAKEHGFNPVIVTTSAIFHLTKGGGRRCLKDQIVALQLQLATDFSTLPLAQKYGRVATLTRLIKLAVGDQATTDTQKIRLIQGLLRQIKEEIGEDMDKLAEALAASGTSLNFNFSGAPGEGQQSLRNNIRQLWDFDAQQRNRLESSDG